MTVSQAIETRTFEDAEALAENVAEWLCALAQASNGGFAVCLSGGSTPRRLYETLATPSFASRFPWQRAHWFWGDERFVPHDDPASNYGMVSKALLSRVSAPADNIHPIVTEGVSPEQAAAAYESELKGFYGADALSPGRALFDVTLLGVGDDGHTASLFPAEQTLKEARRWVVPVKSAKYGQRITLTYPALEASRDAAFLVAGRAKRKIVARIRAGDATLPAALVRPVGRLHWFTDRNAVPAGAMMAAATRPINGPTRANPAVVIVMGVSGSGKSTIGTLLAMRLQWEFEDGDWFHPVTNTDKMHRGIPLTDEDRWPWLVAIAEWIDNMRASGGHGVITCSALKRRYRDVLIGDRKDVRLVYLKGDEALIARRFATRHEHFMPVSLLHSQFEALEEPGPAENPITVSIESAPREVVSRILSALNMIEAAPADGPSSLRPYGTPA